MCFIIMFLLFMSAAASVIELTLCVIGAGVRAARGVAIVRFTESSAIR